MDQEAGVDRALAGFLGIERRRRLVDRGQRCGTATAGDHPGARRRRIHVDVARHGERLHELAHPALVTRLHDQVERVLALDDGLALDLDALPSHVRAAQVVQQRRAHRGIFGRALLGFVLMADDEQGHRTPLRRRGDNPSDAVKIRPGSPLMSTARERRPAGDRAAHKWGAASGARFVGRARQSSGMRAAVAHRVSQGGLDRSV
jgi:hypothetical protein